MVQNETISVELVYIKPDCQTVLILDLEQGSTIKQAINNSGLLQRFPEINLSVNKVGVFSKIKPLDYVLNNDDRIEIYRPLLVDPKEARRRRVKEKQ